jgi:hypothetical protein
MVATNEGNSYHFLLDRLSDNQPDLLLLNSAADLAGNPAVRDHVGRPQPICDGALAYIPDWDSGENRDAATIYLRYLAAHC